MQKSGKGKKSLVSEKALLEKRVNDTESKKDELQTALDEAKTNSRTQESEIKELKETIKRIQQIFRNQDQSQIFGINTIPNAIEAKMLET